MRHGKFGGTMNTKKDVNEYGNSTNADSLAREKKTFDSPWCIVRCPETTPTAIIDLTVPQETRPKRFEWFAVA